MVRQPISADDRWETSRRFWAVEARAPGKDAARRPKSPTRETLRTPRDDAPTEIPPPNTIEINDTDGMTPPTTSAQVAVELKTPGEGPAPLRPETGNTGTGPGLHGQVKTLHTGRAERIRAGGDIAKKRAHHQGAMGIIGTAAGTAKTGTPKDHASHDRIRARNVGIRTPKKSPTLTRWRISSAPHRLPQSGCEAEASKAGLPASTSASIRTTTPRRTWTWRTRQTTGTTPLRPLETGRNTSRPRSRGCGKLASGTTTSSCGRRAASAMRKTCGGPRRARSESGIAARTMSRLRGSCRSATDPRMSWRCRPTPSWRSASMSDDGIC